MPQCPARPIRLAAIVFWTNGGTVGGQVVLVRSLRAAAITTASLSRLGSRLNSNNRETQTVLGFPQPLFPSYGHFRWPPGAGVSVEDLEPRGVSQIY